MKKLTLYTFLPLFLVMAILSCDTTKDVEKPSESVSSDKDSSKKGEQVPDVTADRMLVVELEGMVCKMGCGGEIRKELYATNGVENVSFDFDEEKVIGFDYFNGNHKVELCLTSGIIIFKKIFTG